MNTSDFVATYEAAVTNERATWAMVRNKLPGSPAFDPQLWGEWIKAAELSCAAQELLAKALEQEQRKPG